VTTENAGRASQATNQRGDQHSMDLTGDPGSRRPSTDAKNKQAPKAKLPEPALIHDQSRS
jgi:hypothetical protein